MRVPVKFNYGYFMYMLFKGYRMVSNECHKTKTKTKVVTLANQNFWFYLWFVEKAARYFLANHEAKQCKPKQL